MIRKRKILIHFIVLCAAHSLSFSQTIDHWETIVQAGDGGLYFIPSSEIGTDWTQKDFDDSGWTGGTSGFGVGDNDDNTKLPSGTMSVYIRFTFTVQNISDIASLLLDMDYDDGFVAYINGTEVARSNNIHDPLSWDLDPELAHEAGMYRGVLPERFDLDAYLPTVLNTGENILAVRVHNKITQSSDLSSNVFLHAGLTISGTEYSPVPRWFVPPIVLTESNLPFMLINTHGQSIPDEPRIVADMGLINNGNGAINSVNDEWNEYFGKISIEQRGESSIDFAKKSFSIELQNADSSNNNVSLLGLPKENDFVLNGPYSDKTMLKNVLTYELFRRTGRWAPRTRYIELVVNDEYEGIYVLTEKLKRDENRVDIDKLTFDDKSSLDNSGGYILRRDKKNKLSSAEWWTSPIEQPFHERMWYEYYDPEYDELTRAQKAYIRGWMRKFDKAMSNPEFEDLQDGYRKYINVTSFIDMMFVNEISKGIDNYLFSTYFHKENDADGGRLVAGPPWDYNLGYGNVDYGENWDAKETYGWCYPQWSRIYWYERLMEDERYRDQVHCRWTMFRKTIFTDESIVAFIDSCTTELGEAVDRNFTRFPTLGKYIWPAVPPYPDTYEGEIANLKTWLIDRLEWIDSQWLTTDLCQSESPSNISLSNDSILENQPAGAQVGYFATTDLDSDEHDYVLVSGSGDVDNAKFKIKSNKLLSTRAFDYDAQNNFSIRVQSIDDSNKSVDKVFTIKILKDTSTRVIESNDARDVFDVQQNYPNPFNPTTIIKYSLPQGGFVQLKIYDMLGKEVAILVDNIQSKGNHQIEFNASVLSSGMYFYRIQSGSFTETKKMIVLD
jgi:hypothetical protein